MMLRQNRRTLIAFGAVLAFAWFCYQPAISGAFQLDDYVNLGGLAEVEDTASAIEFMFSGIAGPTGRPLALASFALQAEQWTQGPSAFLRVNILIHLVNAALLAAFLYQLSIQRAVARYEAALVATAAASLWVLMPLLVTASLLIVQRMTTLSAMFMLLGLNGYLYSRARIGIRPKQALAGMSASLIAGTVLATLCKESGLLLPALVLVLEETVLERPGSVRVRDWRIYAWTFLILPLVLLLVYLASWLDYPDHLVASRGFNAWERFMTEGRILWVYLAKAVVGIPGQLGIYQESQAVSRSLASPETILACVAWSGLFLASTVWRRRYPLFSLAVLWYLVGHLIESTVVPLELYFEHRNYIPVIGPLFALASSLIMLPARGRIAGLLVAAIAIINAWFLYSFATLSGDPPFAARYWAAKNPGSHRAVMTLAIYELEEEGPLAVVDTIESTISTYPGLGYMRIPQLDLLCQIAPENDYREIVQQLERQLTTVDFRYAATKMLSDLYSTTSNTKCGGVDPATVISLAEALHTNLRYANDPVYNQFYHKMLAVHARDQGDYDAAIDHLQQAIAHGQSADINKLMVTTLGGAGEFAAARNFIDNAEALRPANPVKALMWQRDLDILREHIRKLEQYVRTQPRD
jgi:tetratricopeptide (TPR) repeat protein